MKYIYVHHIIEGSDKVTVTGIILIAGNSTRFGKKTNKNFEKIKDKYIIEYMSMFYYPSSCTIW